MSSALLQVSISCPDDIFTLRQRGREAAAALGMDDADQARVATALSEVGREALVFGGLAAFSIGPEGSLCVQVHGLPADIAAQAVGTMGLVAARQLMDEVSVGPPNQHGAMTVTLRKLLPPGVPGARGDAPALLDALSKVAPATPLDELQAQNRELLAALEQLHKRQEDLVQLNAELEQTNQGVMAMYSQLSDELEETNRGVVALYAELDDRSVQLRNASEAKSRFLASVSHELRSPVNSILGLARLLDDPSSPPLEDDQRDQVQLIARSATELLSLVNDLLDLAKAESGALQPMVAPVDLATVFQELEGLMRPLVAPGVDLVVEAPEVAAIDTDRKFLFQVLRNMLTNALKFTEAGTVRLAARATSPDEMEIAVSDTGIGIAEEDLDRVFEEFFQVRGPLQVRHKGTGLGLPYALRLARTLGGDLRAQSTFGRGSVFTLTLPRGGPTLDGPEARLDTVLLVDDDECFREILRNLLKDNVGDVLEAPGGPQALEILAQRTPDAIFLDLRMPEMSGTDVLRRLDRDERLREVPVVVVTSAALDQVTPEEIEGAVAVVQKATLDAEAVPPLLASLMQPATRR